MYDIRDNDVIELIAGSFNVSTGHIARRALRNNTTNISYFLAIYKHMLDGGGLLISDRGVGDCGIPKETGRQRENRYHGRRSSRLVRPHLYVNESTSYDKQLVRTKSCERVFPPKLERGYHVKKQENRLSKIH